MTIRAIITDIEGTTSSISFVHDVLFPYARQALPGFIDAHRNDPAVRGWLEQVAAETGVEPDSPTVTDTLLHWIDIDKKHTALKALQGLVWAAGYEKSQFLAHVYPDVEPALRQWKASGRELYVYSSGSVAAQKLLFGYSEAGDLTPLFDGYFDTHVGGKREAASYQAILGEIGRSGDEVVFLSDIVAELDAARDAGLHTILLERSGPIVVGNGHHAVTDFSAIDLASIAA